MNDRRFDKLQTLFKAALELPETQRDAWLVEQCDGDEELLQHVCRLVEHDRRETQFLEQNAVAAMNKELQLAGEGVPGETGQITTASSPDLQSFLSSLLETGLLGEAEVDTIRDQHASEDTEALAQKLVADQKLTLYQAQLLLSGSSQPLKLGNYLILDEIGAGGMGRVYLAEHRRMKRKVALKVLPPEMTADPHAVDRFQREVEAAARLSHAHIVTAYDADAASNVHFFVMEYVEGSDLAALVKRRGPLSVAQAVECLRQVATGLAYAHGQGVVHRDIKPGNLLLDTGGTAKILDMGLARYQTSQEQEDLTNSGMAMGTADFMSPEQGVNAKQADERSDIYSLGCTFYFLLTGNKMYGGESPVEKVMAHQNDPIPGLASDCPQASPELRSVFRKMVAKSPKDRFQSADELLTAVMALPEASQSPDFPTGTGSPLQSAARGDNLRSTQFREPLVPQPNSETFPSSLYDDTKEHASPVQAVGAGSGSSRGRRWMLFGLGFAALLIAAAIIEVQTRYGTLRVEVLDPNLSLQIDDELIRFQDKKYSKKKRFGNHRLAVLVSGRRIPIDNGIVVIDGQRRELTVSVDGKRINSNLFEVTRRGTTVVKISLSKISLSPGPLDSVTRHVASSSSNRNVQDVPAFGQDREVAEWVLSIGGSVGISSGGRVGSVNEPYVFQQISDFRSLPTTPFKLVTVAFYGCSGRLTSEDLRRLIGLPLLIGVNVSENPALDARALSFLVECPSLRTLWMNKTAIHSSDLVVLNKLKTLRVLCITIDQIDDNWGFLEDLPSLHRLIIANRLSALDAAAMKLPETSQLRVLELLDITSVDDAVVRRLQASHPNLRVVVGKSPSARIVGRDPITLAVKQLADSGWSLRGFLDDGSEWDSGSAKAWNTATPAAIHRVVLPRQMRVTSDQVRLLSSLPLDVFRFEAKALAGADRLSSALPDLDRIQILDLSHSDLTNQGLAQLVGVSYLRDLDIRSTKVTRAAIEDFRRQVPTCVVVSDFGTFEYEHRIPDVTEANQAESRKQVSQPGK